jgi:hypothetical protein
MSANIETFVAVGRDATGAICGSRIDYRTGKVDEWKIVDGKCITTRPTLTSAGNKSV